MEYKKEIGREEVLPNNLQVHVLRVVCNRIQLSGGKKTISETIEALTNNQRRHIVNLHAPAQRTLEQ